MNEKERLEAYLEKCENERFELLSSKAKIETSIKRLTIEINESNKILNAL